MAQKGSALAQIAPVGDRPSNAFAEIQLQLTAHAPASERDHSSCFYPTPVLTQATSAKERSPYEDKAMDCDRSCAIARRGSGDRLTLAQRWPSSAVVLLWVGWEGVRIMIHLYKRGGMFLQNRAFSQYRNHYAERKALISS